MHYPFELLQFKSHFHGNENFNENSINIEFLLEQDILPSPEGDKKINKIWFVTSKYFTILFAWNTSYLM